MYNDIGDILETISMIRDKNLDVRTTTMGIWWKPAKRLPESTEFQL